MRNKKMGVFLGVCALATLSTSCAGKKGYETYADAKRYSVGEFTGDVSAVKRVEIDWLGGSIDVEQSADGTLTFTEEVPAETDAQRAQWYLDGSVLRIRYCKSGYDGKIREENKHLQLQLPVGLGLDIESKNSEITIGQTEFSSLAIESVSGNVTGEKWTCSGRVDIETSSASVAVGEILAKSLEIDGGSGNVYIERVNAPDIQMETTSGRMDVGITERTEAELETGDGNINVRLLSGLGASVRFETRRGAFHCEKPYERFGGRYDVYGENGQTDCPVYVETKNGNLYIR